MDEISMNWKGAFSIDDKLVCENAAHEKREFEVRVERIDDPDGSIWHYLVKPVTPPDTSGKLYFAGFRQVKEGLLQVGELTNPLPSPYQRCGITRALFALVAKRHKANIRSSKTVVPDEEMRSPEATGLWKRMVRDGLARYDASEDRFYYTLGAI